ncbi:MAG: hypothetical protein AAGF19_01330 [Pseudomonadota bacterium]
MKTLSAAFVVSVALSAVTNPAVANEDMLSGLGAFAGFSTGGEEAFEVAYSGDRTFWSQLFGFAERFGSSTVLNGTNTNTNPSVSTESGNGLSGIGGGFTGQQQFLSGSDGTGGISISGIDDSINIGSFTSSDDLTIGDDNNGTINFSPINVFGDITNIFCNQCTFSGGGNTGSPDYTNGDLSFTFIII